MGKCTLKDVLLLVRDHIGDNCICIETGAQHDFDEKNKDYYSTTNIIEHICKPKNGILYSFDIEQQVADLCKKKLDELEVDELEVNESRDIDENGKNKYVRFVVGDSVVKLKECLPTIIAKSIGKRKGIDLVFLDSKEFDEDHMLKEINLIRPYLGKRCIIMCDDIHNSNSIKWKRAVPYIKEWVDRYWEAYTPTGLFVGIIGIVGFIEIIGTGK